MHMFLFAHLKRARCLFINMKKGIVIILKYEKCRVPKKKDRESTLLKPKSV